MLNVISTELERVLHSLYNIYPLITAAMVPEIVLRIHIFMGYTIAMDYLQSNRLGATGTWNLEPESLKECDLDVVLLSVTYVSDRNAKFRCICMLILLQEYNMLH